MKTSPKRLLVGGWIDLVDSEVSRGMPVLVADGSMVGVVAAVVQAGPGQTIDHILLGQVPPTAIYRLIPIDMLDRLDDQGIWLRVSRPQITALPIHRPDC